MILKKTGTELGVVAMFKVRPLPRSDVLWRPKTENTSVCPPVFVYLWRWVLANKATFTRQAVLGSRSI